MTIDVTPSGEVVLRLSGRWTLVEGLADARSAAGAVSASTPRVRFDAGGIEAWDTSLVTFLAAVADACTEHGVELDLSLIHISEPTRPY